MNPNFSFISSHDASFVSSSLPSTRPSSYHPNYPVKDPVFIIPNVPELTKVPEPRPLKRAPPPGYDMRTLRKQLDFLYAEIDERTETQALLYRQNEELWNYTQSLLEANKVNVSTMRSQVTCLHDELRTLHDERKILAEKLQLAQNSSELLRKLDIDIGSLRSAGSDAESLRKEAESQLLRAKEERHRLEQELQAQEDELHNKHLQLDELRARKLEEESLNVADKFFQTSSAVLKSAYVRFKNSVCANMRLSKINDTLSSLYRRHLKAIHWKLWQRYLLRRRVMHDNTTARNLECRDLCFDRWRLFALHEKLCHANQRVRVLRSYFQDWLRYSNEEKWNKRANFQVLTTLYFHDYSFVVLYSH